MSFKTFAALGLTLSVGAVSLFIGCSSDDSSGTTSKPDAGNGDTGAPSGNVTQKGSVLELQPAGQPVSGATVTLGTATATTDDFGNYTISVPKDTAFSLKVSAPSHANLFDQEYTLSGDADRGPSLLTSNVAAQGLSVYLTGFDPTLAVLAVGVINVGSCPDQGTATISVGTGAGDAGSGDAGSSDAGAGPQVVYINSQGYPDPKQHSVVKGLSQPSAVIYNLPTDGSATISVTRDKCTQVTASEYPYPDPQVPNIKYTGKYTLQAAGNVADRNVTGNISFVRVFIK